MVSVTPYRGREPAGCAATVSLEQVERAKTDDRYEGAQPGDHVIVQAVRGDQRPKDVGVVVYRSEFIAAVRSDRYPTDRRGPFCWDLTRVRLTVSTCPG